MIASLQVEEACFDQSAVAAVSGKNDMEVHDG